MSTCGSELLRHEFVDRLYKRFRKVTATDAGLIRDNDHWHSEIVQSADGFRDKGQDTKTAHMIQVADLF
jgi:hypothetical protein